MIPHGHSETKKVKGNKGRSGYQSSGESHRLLVHINVETSEHITPQSWGPPQCILPPLIMGGPELPFIINSLQVYYVPEVPEGLHENLSSIFG